MRSRGKNVTFVTYPYGMSPPTHTAATGGRCMCANVKLTYSMDRRRLSRVIILYLEVKCEHLHGLTILHGRVDQVNDGTGDSDLVYTGSRV